MLVFVARHADGDDVGVTGMVQYGIGVMYRAVYGIAVDVFENWLIFGVAVFDITILIEFFQFVFMTFIFDKHGVVTPVFTAL